jgi:hypothetical protein
MKTPMEDLFEWLERRYPLTEQIKDTYLEKEAAYKSKELLIELEEWDHTCGDGCCYTYGIDIFINGERIEDEDGSNPHQLLKAVLNKLGYTDVKVEYKYNEQDTTK